jgi:transcriptional regulator with PAS, ATPase and Fis domain
VPLHCAALPSSLLESELFGHEKGSFTGASATRRGRFEEANGGTLFLDEIGDIGPEIQIKLLRVLQERKIERVGSNQSIDVDVRIVCATNRDLLEEVKAGCFREDLYYRLNVIRVEPPPLRERKEDLELLARHFVARYGKENDKIIDEISPQTLEVMRQHNWPGNVRELENAMEHAVVLAEHSRIEPRHLPESIRPRVEVDTAAPVGFSSIEIPGSTLDDIELHAILKTYESSGGNTRLAAEVLGISQRKVQYRLRDLKDRGLIS